MTKTEPISSRWTSYFITGLAYGIGGYLSFNILLALVSYLISLYIGAGLDSLGAQLVLGVPLLYLSMIVSLGLIAAAGTKVLSKRAIDAPSRYAIFGIVITGCLFSILQKFVPISLTVGTVWSLGADVLLYGSGITLLSLLVAAFLCGCTFIAIHAIQLRSIHLVRWWRIDCFDDRC